MHNSLARIFLLTIIVISALMHMNHFNKDLVGVHVWRQTQTQSTTNNFYEEDMNLFQPSKNDRGASDGIFRVEFPLMQWLNAALFKVFGQDILVTRLFMFFIGLLSVFGMYRLLLAFFNHQLLAIMGAWAFNFSPSFFYYTINPLPDNLALCFSIWGLALFFGYLQSKNGKSLIISGLLLALGALCKLPFIIYFIVPLAYFIKLKAQKDKDASGSLVFTSLTFSLLPILWYAWVIPQWTGNPVVKGMLDNGENWIQLLDYLQHNLISTLPELLLNYGSTPLFIAGFYFLFKRKSYKGKLKFHLILALAMAATAYYLFEANAIAKIHDYYLFPFYPVLFMLVAYGAYHMFQSESKLAKYACLTLLIILPITAYLRTQNSWNLESPGFNKNLLDYKTELRNAVPKDALVVAGNDKSHFIFLYYIDKKGWAFDTDQMDAEKLKSMIKAGAEYLYTDSPKIVKEMRINGNLGTQLFAKGGIYVFHLKSKHRLNE